MATIAAGPASYAKLLLGSVNRVMLRHPQKFAMFSGGCKCFTGDLMAQKADALMNGVEFRYDWKRSAVFVGFGCFYVGIGQYFLYNYVYHYIFGPANPLKKLTVELCVHTPVLYMPTFYVFHTTGEYAQRLVDGEVTMNWIVDHALETYFRNIGQDMKMCFAFWGPVHGLMFFKVPYHWRIPYISVVGTAFYFILSKMRGEIKDVSDVHITDKPAVKPPQQYKLEADGLQFPQQQYKLEADGLHGDVL